MEFFFLENDEKNILSKFNEKRTQIVKHARTEQYPILDWINVVYIGKSCTYNGKKLWNNNYSHTLFLQSWSKSFICSGWNSHFFLSSSINIEKHWIFMLKISKSVAFTFKFGSSFYSWEQKRAKIAKWRA